jgi:hypothetical protein
LGKRANTPRHVTPPKAKELGPRLGPLLREVNLQKLIRHINRKAWWHVPPMDPQAYEKRGKFLASSFKEAEFYGRPNDIPERVVIAAPVIGDDRYIETALIGRVESALDMSVPKRLALDAKLRRAALRRGFDSIVLLTSKGFQSLRRSGVIPRSIELNVVDLGCLLHSSGRISRTCVLARLKCVALKSCRRRNSHGSVLS